MDEHRSAVKEALTCGICMDIIDEPHAWVYSSLYC